MTGSLRHWIYALMTPIGMVAAGSLLIPLLRTWPMSVHEFFNGHHDYVRTAFIFLVCVFCAHVLFKLFSPRLAQLRHWCTNPPMWVACLVGLPIVCWIDVTIGLYPAGYQATTGEWLIYAGGSVALVTLVRCCSTRKQGEEPAHEPDEAFSMQKLVEADWEEIEKWLNIDALAKHDLLENRAVAIRLTKLLMSGTRSIGIVSPLRPPRYRSMRYWRVASERLKQRLTHCS